MPWFHSIQEAGDVAKDNPVDGSILQYNDTTRLWEILFGSDVYVPYTGATANVDLGAYDFATTDLHAHGNFTNYNSNLVDIGLEQDSDLKGYHLNYITDKALANISIGYNSSTVNGALRVDSAEDPDKIEVYLDGYWRNILYDNVADLGDLRHTPLEEQIHIWRGDSVKISMSGRPMIKEYTASMGAYTPPSIINGGTF